MRKREAMLLVRMLDAEFSSNQDMSRFDCGSLQGGTADVELTRASQLLADGHQLCPLCQHLKYLRLLFVNEFPINISMDFLRGHVQ